MITFAILCLALALSIALNLWQAVRPRRAEHTDWSQAETDRIHRSATKAKPMRTLPLLLCLALLAPLAAADQPPQLDPTKPRDAVQVVEILTRDLTLPRVQAQALVQAIQTLAQTVERDERAQAAAAADNTAKPED